MTTEVGIPSKTIRYINVHKEGLRDTDTISIDNRWTTPQLEKQSDYLVAISRFEVPLNRVPVTAKMDNCIEIFRYNDNEQISADPDDEKEDALMLLNMVEDDGTKKNFKDMGPNKTTDKHPPSPPLGK